MVLTPNMGDCAELVEGRTKLLVAQTEKEAEIRLNRPNSKALVPLRPEPNERPPRVGASNVVWDHIHAQILAATKEEAMTVSVRSVLDLHLYLDAVDKRDVIGRHGVPSTAGTAE